MNRTFPVSSLAAGVLITLNSGDGIASATEQVSMTSMQCGDLRILVGYQGDTARLVVGDERFDMRQVAAASGARYEALDDPTTTLWSKGENALLELRGQSHPECTPAGAEDSSFRASGNEPGWRLDIGDEELTLVTNYGADSIVALTPAAETADDFTRYVVDTTDHELTVTVFERICADTMSGMPHPNTVVVVLDGEELNGCGGDPTALLRGPEWTVEDIDGGGIVDRSRVTIEFGDDDRVSGAASCNRYMGSYSLTGEGLTLGQMASTMMACPEAIMDQEQRFLAILAEVQRFEMGQDGALVLHTNDGRTITARR
jgi:heat shock protein HslJ/membrane-bound inhibitor of C-type lysozyme